MRQKQINRATAETKINLSLNVDGKGDVKINTGVGFFDHMLTLLARHAHFDLTAICDGDVEVDQHHSVEDIGIVLGQAFYQCLGDKAGIKRYADVTIPMDEALATVNLDISGRPYFVYQVEGLKDKVGQFDTELVEEFFQAFASHAKVTLHVRVHYGKNTHHMIEAIFKAFGRALAEASLIDGKWQGVPSTKGLLE